MPEYPDTSTSSGLPLRHDTVEGGEQCVNLALSTVQLFRNQQPVWNVVFAKREIVDVAPRSPTRQDNAEGRAPGPTRSGIAPQQSLASSFIMMAESIARNALAPLVGRNGLSCDMAVHPFHRIGSGEGETPGQHLVKRDAQSVEITARIDRTIHSSGLFRSHVGECSSDELGGRRGTAVRAEDARRFQNP